ncbi:hypothetical protein QIH01_20065 [Brevibacillus brevis]|uniref:hypothetical protein n=1 Tax=Brevibacillus brevis TaxID=1393 RepID=UPI0027A4C893|nr:hypothetical protein QIH01_20065 [Brevibacillus brevis]
MFKKSMLALTAAIVCAGGAYSTSFAKGPIEEFNFTRYEAKIKVKDASVHGYAQAEAEGKDMRKLTVKCELYSEGIWQERDTGEATSKPWFAYARTDAVNWINDGYEVKAIFTAKSKSGDTLKETDSDRWKP